MKSPRFDLREREIRAVLSSSLLKQTWKQKIRAKLRQQLLTDPIEHLDFHINLTANCQQLERLVCDGGYVPGPTRRILIEKSKGLCRQIVILNVPDALLLQRLSDSLYSDIKGKAPSSKAFFEPEDHSFSNLSKALFHEPRYG